MGKKAACPPQRKTRRGKGFSTHESREGRLYFKQPGGVLWESRVLRNWRHTASSPPVGMGAQNTVRGEAVQRNPCRRLQGLHHLEQFKMSLVKLTSNHAFLFPDDYMFRDHQGRRWPFVEVQTSKGLFLLRAV